MTDTNDTLPAWLYQRFMPAGEGWDNLDDDDRSYWEHHARAVRRAVARGGFKTAAPTDWIDGHPQLEAIASAVYERCETGDGGIVVDDPRNIAVAALKGLLEPSDHGTVATVNGDDQP